MVYIRRLPFVFMHTYTHKQTYIRTQHNNRGLAGVEYPRIPSNKWSLGPAPSLPTDVDIHMYDPDFVKEKMFGTALSSEQKQYSPSPPPQQDYPRIDSSEYSPAKNGPTGAARNESVYHDDTINARSPEKENPNFETVYFSQSNQSQTQAETQTQTRTRTQTQSQSQDSSQTQSQTRNAKTQTQQRGVSRPVTTHDDDENLPQFEDLNFNTSGVSSKSSVFTF
jgi:hypothetical protein